jgi:deoxyribodipyrimidine photo-lyase
VAAGAFRPEYNQIQWQGTDAQFDAWCAGQTGYPIVDAAMRCLNATGWMHNRLRMIVAMFLTKDLMVNWQRGERYFMRTLVDGDLAANNGGWQWSAGCGTDAAPYFRIFNPVTQGKKCDPDGAFVRQWVPELADAPSDCIQEPWARPLLLARSRYVPPIVQHDVQRGRCLAMFKAVKGAAAPSIPNEETHE